MTRRREAPPGAEEPQAGGSQLAPPLPVWARELTRLLDDSISIPGTDRKIGIDPIVGFLIPGAGDALMAIVSVSLLGLALKRGVPKVVLFKMVTHLTVDAVVGAVPVAGDFFDAVYHANRRNLTLIERYQRHGEKPGASEYALVGLGVAVLLVGIALPIVAVVLVGWAIARAVGGG